MAKVNFLIHLRPNILLKQSDYFISHTAVVVRTSPHTALLTVFNRDIFRRHCAIPLTIFTVNHISLYPIPCTDSRVVITLIAGKFPCIQKPSLPSGEYLLQNSNIFPFKSEVISSFNSEGLTFVLSLHENNAQARHIIIEISRIIIYIYNSLAELN